MIDAEKKLKSLYTREIKVSPLPPATLTGINTPGLVREIFEFYTWALDYYPADYLLEDSIKVPVDILKKCGEGRQPYLEPRRMRLPAREEGKFKLWHSGGSTPEYPLPISITAMEQPEEVLLVASMLEELRSKLAVNLDPSPSFERGLGGQVRPKQARDFLVIGSSNASKLSAALAEQGFLSW
jgi:hypothetical protein